MGLPSRSQLTDGAFIFISLAGDLHTIYILHNGMFKKEVVFDEEAEQGLFCKGARRGTNTDQANDDPFLNN